MANRSNVHVTPRGDKWAVVREGAERASFLQDTQAEAIDAGRGIAKPEGGSLYIHGQDNKIREEYTYPRSRDQYPPRG